MVKAQCSECGKTFGSQCSLIRHNRELHQKKKVQRFVSSPIILFHQNKCSLNGNSVVCSFQICFYCEKMFPRKQNLTMHIQTAHSNYMKHENFDDSQPKFVSILLFTGFVDSMRNIAKVHCVVRRNKLII